MRVRPRELGSIKPPRTAARRAARLPESGRGKCQAARTRTKQPARMPALRGDGEDAEGAAGAVDEFEGGGDDHGACGGQLIEIAKAGEAKLSASVHDVVV